MEKKTVNINGVTYSAEVTHRAMIDFERQSGKPFYQANSLEDSDRLMFCALKHGCKLQNIEFPLSFEQFIDYVDAHPEVMDFSTEKKTNDSDESVYDIDKMRAKAVGVMGLSLDDFLDLTPSQFIDILIEWSKHEEEKYKNEWEQTRLILYVTALPHLKNPEKHTLQSLFPMRWDKKPEQPKPSTRERFEEVKRKWK